MLQWAAGGLNDEVEEREREREGKWTVILQPASAQELMHFMRKESGPYINVKRTTIWLKGGLQANMQPTIDCIIKLALTRGSSCQLRLAA